MAKYMETGEQDLQFDIPNGCTTNSQQQRHQCKLKNWNIQCQCLKLTTTTMKTITVIQFSRCGDMLLTSILSSIQRAVHFSSLTFIYVFVSVSLWLSHS